MEAWTNIQKLKKIGSTAYIKERNIMIQSDIPTKKKKRHAKGKRKENITDQHMSKHLKVYSILATQIMTSFSPDILRNIRSMSKV